jgi:hypothetical protein
VCKCYKRAYLDDRCIEKVEGSALLGVVALVSSFAVELEGLYWNLV